MRFLVFLYFSVFNFPLKSVQLNFLFVRKWEGVLYSGKVRCMMGKLWVCVMITSFFFHISLLSFFTLCQVRRYLLRFEDLKLFWSSPFLSSNLSAVSEHTLIRLLGNLHSYQHSKLFYIIQFLSFIFTVVLHCSLFCPSWHQFLRTFVKLKNVLKYTLILIVDEFFCG